jgi:hypothetical protein
MVASMTARPFFLVRRVIVVVSAFGCAVLGCSFDKGGTGDDIALDSGALPGLDGAVDDSSVSIDAPPRDSSELDVPPVEDSTPTPDDGPAVDTADATPVTCGSGELPFEGHCYFVDLTSRNFLDSRKACEGAGPTVHLVTINSYAEDTFVSSITIGLEAWMGLTRDPPSNPKLRSSFKWITGEPMLVDAWRGTEPDGSGQCARHTGTGWADSGCSESFAAICERE